MPIRPIARKPGYGQFFSKRNNRLLQSVLTVENSLILLFFILGLVGILNHEIWRDEAQAWLIARDSSSLQDLFSNTAYEGHPLVWHACLFLITRWSNNPFYMQIFHLLFSTASVVLLIKWAPFSLLQKGLLSFSYLLFYEYSIISRNYAIGIFFIFLFCVLYTQTKPRYWLLALLIAMAANANAFCFMISFSLASVMIFRQWRESPTSLAETFRRQMIQPLAILIVGWGLSLLQLTRLTRLPEREVVVDSAQRSAAGASPVQVPVSDLVLSQFDQVIAFVNRLAGVSEPFTRSYLPMLRPKLNFWTTHFLLDSEGIGTVFGLQIGMIISAIFAIVVFFFASRALRRTPLYLWLYVSASAALYSLFIVIYRGSSRHQGHLFIVLIVSLWLATWSKNRQNQPIGFHTRPKRRSLKRHSLKRPIVGGVLLSVLLIFQCIASVQAYAMDIVYPFSGSRAIAQYIRTNQLEELPLFAQNGRISTGVISYLDTMAYYAQRNRYASFATAPYRRKEETNDIILANVESFAQQEPEFLVLSRNPIDFSGAERQVNLLAKVEETIIGNEQLYLYRAEAPSP
ncbi:hypothetical protein S7335_1990 [Synechococcus sp. PCC 7335]|uniref:hypothetical protein n=1 Tax=Synechococcus sp. (strain ATCC 29403 / PCC 7335) TaxID=91464 RepID=UPI00017ED5B7|nr:hypothetical protein [Synechococcus sp. PCC 7335]EDX84293.1 hypothetical protein S7335_1990 [Synechococcus sp. PCC 7335]